MIWRRTSTPSLEQDEVGHVDQVGESDASRLTRLARKYDGVYKHGGGLLLIVPRALARSVVSTGRQLALARLLPDVVLRWTVRYLDRPVVAAVRASYQDLEAGMPGSVEVGSGRPRKRLPQLYHDEAAATAAARSHLAAAARAAARLTASVAGDPTLTAAQPLEIPGLHPNGRGDMDHRAGRPHSGPRRISDAAPSDPGSWPTVKAPASSFWVPPVNPCAPGESPTRVWVGFCAPTTISSRRPGSAPGDT